MHKPNTYDERDLGSKSHVAIAKVESVRKVEITGDSSGIGKGVGLLLGGALGYNMIGNGSGKTYGALLGALLGVAAAFNAESNFNSRQGLELILIDNYKQRYVIVQDDDGTVFNIGDSVNIIHSGGKTRAVKRV